MQPHLQNHKSSVKLQLMRFLGSLPFPKALKLQYNCDMNEMLRNMNKQTTAVNDISPGRKKMTNQVSKHRDWLERYVEKDQLREKVETIFIYQVRDLLETNGARNLTNLSSISPLPNERTIFLSKAIRLQPKLSSLEYDPSDQNKSL